MMRAIKSALLFLCDIVYSALAVIGGVAEVVIFWSIQSSAGALSWIWVQASICSAKLWAIVSPPLFYFIWSAIVVVTVVLMLGKSGVTIAPPHIAVFGYVIMLDGFQLGVVQDNGLAIFLIEICCFTIHAHAWKITTVIDVMDKFSNPLRKLFVSKEQKSGD